MRWDATRPPLPRSVGEYGGLVLPQRGDYLMWTPEMARLMISRWISLVPSKMVKIFEINAYSQFRALRGPGIPVHGPRMAPTDHE